MLTAPTLDELVTFTGRPTATFGAFAAEALAQATLMFSIVTKLTGYPDDPDLLQLAKNAILEMADRLLLEQPFAEVSVRPFQTETIGNYSYSRATATVASVANGFKTGLFWWDIALEQLTIAGATSIAHGSIAVVLDGLNRAGDGTWSVRDPAADASPFNPPYLRIS